MTVRDQKSAESPQAIQSLVSVLLRGLLVDGSAWELGIATTELLAVPDEVLQQVAVVLREDENLGLLDDRAGIADEFPTLIREVFRRVGELL